MERPGEVVTREELQRRLWPSDVFVDFESGLNTAANRLRITLGDSAESPRYIETLARTGYRFVAPVEEVPSPLPAVSTAPFEPGPHGPSLAVVLLSAALVVMTIGTVLALRRSI